MTWRHVDSDLSEPAYTAAADEALALARSKNRVPNTLHLYRRACPTVSLGYFQKIHESIDLDFCRNNGIRILRRVTGGSAIYTDRDHLIYGLALDAASVPEDRRKSIERICSAIVLALDNLGIYSTFKPVNDILVGGRKISGSAQMRRRGVVLQHGTLILKSRVDMMLGALRTDPEKAKKRGLEPENYVTSLEEALGHEPDISRVKTALLEGFETVFDVEFENSGFTDFETENIHALMENKYGLDEWNMRL